MKKLVMMIAAMAIGGVGVAHASDDGRSKYMARQCFKVIKDDYFSTAQSPEYSYWNVAKGSGFDVTNWVTIEVTRQAPWNAAIPLTYKAACEVDTRTFEVVNVSQPKLHQFPKP